MTLDKTTWHWIKLHQTIRQDHTGTDLLDKHCHGHKGPGYFYWINTLFFKLQFHQHEILTIFGDKKDNFWNCCEWPHKKLMFILNPHIAKLVFSSSVQMNSWSRRFNNQQALKCWSKFSMVWCGRMREVHVTTSNPGNNIFKLIYFT